MWNVDDRARCDDDGVCDLFVILSHCWSQCCLYHERDFVCCLLFCHVCIFMFHFTSHSVLFVFCWCSFPPIFPLFRFFRTVLCFSLSFSVVLLLLLLLLLLLFFSFVSIAGNTCAVQFQCGAFVFAFVSCCDVWV